MFKLTFKQWGTLGYNIPLRSTADIHDSSL